MLVRSVATSRVALSVLYRPVYLTHRWARENGKIDRDAVCGGRLALAQGTPGVHIAGAAWRIRLNDQCAAARRSMSNCIEYLFLPARRYASAGTSYGPVSVSVCVCLSRVGVLSKWMDGPSWFLALRLLSTYPTLCCKEIQVSTEIRVLPFGT